jgi:hypothetical protein
MTDSVTETRSSPVGRYAPLIVIALGAGLGWWLFGDRLTFAALAEKPGF